MEDPGGSENFKHGGWTFEISRGDEGDKFKLDETLEAEALLLGRVTYEGFAAAWLRGKASSPTSSTRCRSTSSRPRWISPSGTTQRS
jgi:hypothetical protein